MRPREIMEIKDIDLVNKILQEQEAELRKLRMKGTGTMKQLDKKETGQFRRIRKTIARLLTRRNQLDKGFCTKGGLHIPFQTRSNVKMCKKCRKVLKKNELQNEMSDK